MGIIKSTGKAAKFLVDVPRWMHIERTTEYSNSLFEIIKRIFIPRKAEIKENFETAVQRLNLSESALRQRQIYFRRIAYLFLIIFILILAYAIFLFVGYHFRAGFLAAVIAFIALAQFYRNHFWYYQMKQRKLGVTFREWFNNGLLGRK